MTQMARTEEKPIDAPTREGVGQDIAKELLELRADVSALAASLQRYGALSADDLKSRAQGVTDETLAETLRHVHDLRQMVDTLQSRVEVDLRARPLVWLAGALGLGLLVGLIVSRRE
jgi:ElaB/YqjD/DUF883 family membrane-anchored ribosome-binding protein